MNFEIRNYRKVKKANIDIDKITAIGGKGGGGKSSTLGGIGSVITGNPIPFENFLKKDHKKLINHGSKTGYIEVQTENTMAKIDFPDCKYTTGGSRPTISKYSAGLSSLVDLDPSGLNRYITFATGQTVAKEDLYHEMEKQGIIDKENADELKDFSMLWESIELNGIDVIHKDLKGQGRGKKGVWEHITGEKYGVIKGAEWCPSGYSEEDLINSSVEAIHSEIETYKEWLGAAQVSTALSDQQREELEKLVIKEEPVKNRLDLIVDQISNLKKEIDKNRKTSVIVAGLKCPGCGMKLSMHAKTLVCADPKHETYEYGGHKDIEKMEEDLRDLIQRKTKGEMTYSQILQAKRKLEAKTVDNPENIVKIENSISLLKDKLEAIKKYYEAKDIHNDIIKLSKLVNILSPDGIRLSKLKPEIEKCNNFLKEMCRILDVEEIKIDEKMNITSGGIVFNKLLLSRSEQYIISVLFQLLVAIMEMDDFIIIDDMDILTKDMRKKFIKMLLSPIFKEKKFLIAIAGDDKNKFPDFSKVVQGGISYWINDGITEKIGA